MNRRASPWLTRIFNRRVAMALLYLALVVGVALALGLADTDDVGRLASADGWLRDRSAQLFVWRMGLYAAAARVWWSVRCRLQHRNALPELHQRLVRTEVAIAMVIAMLEIVMLLQDL